MIFKSIFYQLINLLINMPRTSDNQSSQHVFDNQPRVNQEGQNWEFYIKSFFEQRKLFPALIMPTIIAIIKSMLIYYCMMNVSNISKYCEWLATIAKTGKDESNLPTVCINEMCIYQDPSVYSEYRNLDCDDLIDIHLGTVYEDPNKYCNMNGENSLNNHLPGAISALIAPFGFDIMTQLILNNSFEDNNCPPFACFFNIAYGFIAFMACIVMYQQDENIKYLESNQDPLLNEQRWLANNIKCKINEHEGAISTYLRFIYSGVIPSVICTIFVGTGFAIALLKDYCQREQLLPGEMEMQSISESRSTEFSPPPQRGQGAGYSSSHEVRGTDAGPVMTTESSVRRYPIDVPSAVVVPMREGILVSPRDNGGRV